MLHLQNNMILLIQCTCMVSPHATLARLQLTLNVWQCVLHAYDVFHPFHSCFFKILLFVDACHSTSTINAAFIYYWSAVRGLENALSMFYMLHHLLTLSDFVGSFFTGGGRGAYLTSPRYISPATPTDLTVRFLVVPFFEQCAGPAKTRTFCGLAVYPLC